MLRVMVVGCALALAGCQTDGGQAPVATSTERPPTDYRQPIIAKVKKTFFDPYSIRDAAISQPFTVNAVHDGVTFVPHSGWIVCLRANAKNRMGGYTGVKDTAFLFKHGYLHDVELAPHHCAKAAYEPFPEIEEGYKPAAPASAPTARRRAS